MSKNSCRQKLMVGSVIKIHDKVQVGTDKYGVPCWRMVLTFSTKINREYISYDYLWLKEVGDFHYKVGDLVQITSILGISSALRRNNKGGNIVLRMLDVTTKKVELGEEE